jgi:hypothetical protein
VIFHRAALLLLMFTPLVAGGQSTSPFAELRSKAIAQGSVQVKVTTRAVADAPTAGRTQAQRFAIQLAQQRLLLDLIPKGLVLGNEISMQADGAFTMRVFPDAIDYLAASNDVAALDEAVTSKRAQP